MVRMIQIVVFLDIALDLIFASLNRTFAVWSLPADTDHAQVTGDLKMITAGPSEVLP